MIHDVLNEYIKTMDWYIEKYPGSKIILEVENLMNDKENPRFEFLMKINVGTDVYQYTGNYITKKMFEDKFYYGDIKSRIDKNNRRAIQQYYDLKRN